MYDTVIDDVDYYFVSNHDVQLALYHANDDMVVLLIQHHPPVVVEHDVPMSYL